MKSCRTLLSIVLVGALVALFSHDAHVADTAPKKNAAQVGPQQPTYQLQSSTLIGKNETYIRKNNRMQKAGHILLIAGSTLCLAGVIIMETLGTFTYGPIGAIAFVSAGTGIAGMLTSFVLLGFSRPYHGTGKHYTASPQFGTAKSAQLTFVKNF